MTKYRENFRKHLQETAIKTFRAAIEAEDVHSTPWNAAQMAWEAVRKLDKKARAPWWDVALSTNTGKRAYRSPLGAVFGIDIEVGSHSARYPQTESSKFEVECLQNRVLELLVLAAFPTKAERRAYQLSYLVKGDL